mgnify:CR=1 FL=1
MIGRMRVLVAVSLVAMGCSYQADIFCEEETCFDLLAQESFMCDDVVCADYVVDGYCATRFECTSVGTCVGVELKPGYSDDPCVVNRCEDGEWVQEPLDVDDGDPCTLDECDPGIGPAHPKIC